MPIYEYKCKSCEANFEMYRSTPSNDAEVKCPQCGSKNTERQLSSFFGKGNEGEGCGPKFFSG